MKKKTIQDFCEESRKTVKIMKDKYLEECSGTEFLTRIRCAEEKECGFHSNEEMCKKKKSIIANYQKNI